MRRLAAVSIVALLLVSLLISAVPLSIPHVRDDALNHSSYSLSAPTFPTGLNTSSVVREYPLISRALMVPSGSSDAILAELNGDNRTDLIVANYLTKNLSIFYRQDDGNFTSYPSYVATLSGFPIDIETIDRFSNGRQQIVVLERKNAPSDTDILEILNYTSNTSYSRQQRQPPHDNVSAVAVDDFDGDGHPDIAVCSSGVPSSTSQGRITISLGPSFLSWDITLKSGQGSNSLAASDFNHDGKADLACANFYDSDVLIYYQPFSDFMPVSLNLTVSGNPTSIVSGKLSSGDYDDLAVVTTQPDAVRFYFQSLVSPGVYSLPTTESYSRAMSSPPSKIICGDMNGDSRDDLLALSEADNYAFGFYQHASVPVWSSSANFMLPTQAGPRSALIGLLDNGSDPDILIVGARQDWSGSSVGLYPGHPTSLNPDYYFMNSNWALRLNPAAVQSMVANGDINGDGVEDTVVLFPSMLAFALMITPIPMWDYHDLGFAPGRMYIGNFNGDMYDDILVTESGTSNLTVFFGSESPAAGFESELVTCGGTVSDVATGDLNHDMMPDLAVATSNGMIDVFFNTGLPTHPFSVRTEFSRTPGTAIPSLVIADFNSDGLDDLAYSNATSADGAIDVFLQHSDNLSLARPPDLPLTSSVPGHFEKVWSGDLDGDGSMDIAAMPSASANLYLYFQQDFASGSQVPNRAITFPEVPSFVSVTDATDDGHADLIIILPSTDLLFLYRQASGLLPDSPSMTFVTGALPNYAVVGDFTGDHWPDLATSDAGSHCLSIWQQNTFPPVAHADGPYNGTEGSPIELEATVDVGVSERPYIQYNWSFGDGTSSGWVMDPMVSHAYPDEGTYDAMLTVRDSAGKTDSNSTSVIVVDSVPKADFTWSPLHPKEGQLITFTDNTSHFDAIVLRNWTVDGALISSGTNSTIYEKFDDGIHTVSLRVFDSDGSTNISQKLIVVGTLAPTVTITAPATAYEGSSVNFVATVDPWHGGPQDSIVSYEWDFSYIAGAFVTEAYTNHSAHTFMTLTASTVYTVVCRATDDDGNQSMGFFNITILDVTFVTVHIATPGALHEFQAINLTVSVDSSSTPVSYEWDFSVVGGIFVADETTTGNSTTHIFDVAGYYLLEVRVSLSNGSKKIGSVSVDVLNVPLTGSISDVMIVRDPQQTNDLTFHAYAFSVRFPDIVRSQWSFGDGQGFDLFGGPTNETHLYAPTKDYTFYLNLTDDDGSQLSLTRILKLCAPTIELKSPTGDLVIASGTQVNFGVSDDTTPVMSVTYSLDGGPFVNFTTQWYISTDPWSEGPHTLVVKALDKDGNIARQSEVIIIDDTAPRITVLTVSGSAFGGSRLNITVKIDDANLNPQNVTLSIKFPGDDKSQPFVMLHGDGNVYYRVVEVPLRDGNMEFDISASDLAGNSVITGTQTIHVKVHFIDYAWPYLLAAALLAALGVSVYFMREVDIAVEEAFVVYNDGRLISHTTRRLKPGMDDQILGGMFVAIQDFVKDSFKDVTSFTLRKLDFGEKSVLIEKGEHVFLAVILHRKASRKVAARMAKVVEEIEEVFGEHLVDWDGDLDKVRGVGDLVKKLYSKGPSLHRPAS